MNEFNFNSFGNSNQTISYCEVDKCKAVVDLRQQLDQLKKENEELRNNLSESLMFKFASQDNEIQKLKQTLEEIRGIAEIMNPDCEHEDWACVGNDLFDCSEKSRCPRECKLKILQKINECEVK